MKKSIYIIAAASMIVACDPVEEDISYSGAIVTADELVAQVSVQQVNGKNGNLVSINADGNKVPVQVSNGVETINSTNGTDLLLFQEGENTVYVRGFNADGTIVEKAIKVNVDVMNNPVPPQYGFFTNLSEKKWTWDTDVNGGGWGNAGQTGDGPSLATKGDGTWWSCKPADLAGQMNHSSTGNPTGEEDPNAYMIWKLNGLKIETYAANGTLVRSGTFNFDMKRQIDGWSIGTLTTSAESIFFPWQINSNGYAPTAFEIIQLNEEKMVLTYSGESGLGSWGETTFWRFKAPGYTATFDGLSDEPSAE
ncbi:MAG: hypothetical protein IKR17_00665 [Bacteroidales bacterium]|nr:hypothetical protein [Bacteroidales bacterium]